MKRRTAATELKEALRKSEKRVLELQAELSQAEEKCYEAAAEWEASRDRVEWEHYRALEAERQKWKSRERRLLNCLAGIEVEL